MKALSIHQPWAWAILHAGKNVENRGWATKYRGPLLIHASKTRLSYDREAQIDWQKVYGVALPKWEEMSTGVLLGIVDLIECLPASQANSSPWVEGPICWVLSNPRVFSDPISYRGAQGLFEVSENTEGLNLGRDVGG
jgi:hypothetical protein